MPVAAGVKGVALEVTLVSHVDMTAESGGATGPDGAHHARLIRGQSVTRPVRLAMSAEDIRDLQLRPL